MCPKPFSWAKNKRKLFSDGKSRGPLLAGVALKSREHQLMFFYLYLFENSDPVTHLGCVSVFVHLELKR